MTWRCEACGAVPARALTPDDLDDPWPLCVEHEAGLVAHLAQVEKEPTYTLEETLAMMPWKRRLYLRWRLRAARTVRRR